jgi:hypothetical protein
MIRKLTQASVFGTALLSAAPVLANSTAIPTDQAQVDPGPVTTVFGTIAAGLATIWAVRKVIKLLNKS